jgi:hypothetical protein
MPFNANADRRHKSPKTKYQVTNWPDYDAALVRRGSLTVWLTDEAIAGWHATSIRKRGGQSVYSDLAIETGLASRLVPTLCLESHSNRLDIPWIATGFDLQNTFEKT